MKYRSEIDGLRAVAVLPVILFHAGLEIFSGGFVGVDVFFVISGYLITSILIDEIENQKYSIVNFYERRARRILPALFFVIASTVPFALAWMTPNQLVDLSKALIAVSFFASNILFWKETDYFAPDAEENPMLHTWSLAVEEQYYVFFPVFLYFTWRFGKKPVFWIIVVFAALSLLLSEVAWRKAPSANFYLAPTRVWELFAGSISAFIVHKYGVRSNNTLASLGLIGIVTCIFLYDDSIPFPSVYALIPVVGVVLLVLFAGSETIASKILSNRIFVGIGLISYSAYLWHQPIFALARIRSFEAPSLSLMLALSALSLVLAFFSWKFIEAPFRNKSLTSRKTIFYSSTIFLLVPILIGVTGIATNGLKDQILSPTQKHLLETVQFSPKRYECLNRDTYQNYDSYSESCKYFDGVASVAMFGDSHTIELGYSVAKELEKHSLALKQLSFAVCVPSYGIEVPGKEMCGRWTNEMINQLVKDETIQTVVVSYRIHMALFGKHEGVYPAIPHERPDEEVEQIWNALVQMMDILVKSGKQVIYVLQTPELPKHIRTLIRYETNSDTVIGMPKNWWDKRSEFVTSRLGNFPPEVQIINPANQLCDEQNCYAARDGITYYFDDDHFSLAGSSIFAKQIVSLITDKRESIKE